MKMSQSMKKIRCPTCGRFMRVKAISEKIYLLHENQIPKPRTGKAKQPIWDKLLLSIPKGKALVIPKEVMDYNAVWYALKRRRQKGRFLHLKIAKRKLENGQINTYVINPEESLKNK